MYENSCCLLAVRWGHVTIYTWSVWWPLVARGRARFPLAPLMAIMMMVSHGI